MDLASADVPLSDQQGSVTPLKLARAFLHDSARCLALAQGHRLKMLPDGNIDLAGLSYPFILATLSPTISREEQAPAFSFLVRLLQAAELLHPDGEWLVTGPGMAMWLDQPPASQLLHLRRAWWENLLWDAQALPPLRLPLWLERRWPAIVTTVCTAVAACPANVWTPLASLRMELERAGLLAAPGVAANLPALRSAVKSGVWGLARFLVHSALPRLGLLELTNVEGQIHLRPTEEGRVWLRTALKRRKDAEDVPDGPALVGLPVLAGLPALALELDVPYHDLYLPLPDFPLLTVALATASSATAEITLNLRLTLTAPAACTFVLMHVAEPLVVVENTIAGVPETIAYRATHATIARGIARGYPVSAVLFLLARWTGGELDPAVVHHLQAWDDAQCTLACEPGYCLHGDPAVFVALRARKAFRRRARLLPGGAEAWVSAAEAPALWTYLRQRGYVLPDLSPVAHPVIPYGAASSAVPMSAMLVAAHAYRQLRAHLPRLADVPLDSLLADLENAVPPAERVALQRLLASQEATLAQALGATASAASPPASLPSPALNDLAQIESILQAAITTAATVALTYIDAQAQITYRHVKPLRFEERAPHCYLVAHCTLRDEERHFRLDRIVAAEDVT